MPPLKDLIPLGTDVTRRDALKLLGAGIGALAAGCVSRAGDETIVPYVADPPEHRPGTLVRYASLLVHGGLGVGIVVDTREGRPIKIDGNPAHPASLGGSTPWMQARILDLYDPQRSSAPRLDGVVASWSQIAQRLRAVHGPLWLVMPPRSSPALERVLDELRARHEVHVVCDAPANTYRGSALVHGEPLEVQLDLSRADVVIALDADFTSMPAWARAAAARRTPDARMSRLWVCEPMQTPTGTLADEHLAVPAGDIACVVACIAGELAAHGVAVPRLPAALLARARARLGDRASWAEGAARDLAARRGAVIVGDRQPPVVHALARCIDHALGSGVTLTKPALVDPLGERLDELVFALRTGAVGAVIIVDDNPCYTVPQGLGFREALAAAPFSLHVGAYLDQTALACTAHVPLAHELEAWGDARARDGTLAIGQPLIRRRFEMRSPLELIAALLDEPLDPRTHVRAGLDDAAWLDALRTGVVAGTRFPPVEVTPKWAADAELARELAPPAPATIELALAPSPCIADGRFAANAWLQELPHPITKQTWGNAALMSRATAQRLGVDDEDMVSVATSAGTLALPALVVANAADGSITIELGYGQRVPRLAIADRVGGDAYALRANERYILRGTASRAPGRRAIVRTQTTLAEHGHELAPVASLARFRIQPDFVAHLRGDQPSLLPPQERAGVQWGMSIDTSICTGCSACMVACQAENNIPIVGPAQVARGRHMNWLRVDRYVHDDGSVVNEPLPCQHCETAPCEYVCPVNATTHSPDGLNEQVYNRCIGTRFCSNNCPYKVRRFNWFAFEDTSSRALQFNPDVTVRSRGVMEKCTYCVQRIRRAEHEALVEHRALREGEVTTACQQACPTGAIQFGQLAERTTRFAALRRDPRRFELLHELGTRPRTQYLAKIDNPDPGRRRS